MRHNSRRHAAAWRASLIAAALVACSVYDAPEGDSSNASSSGAVNGDSAGEQGSSTSGVGGGSVSNGGTADSSSGGSAGSEPGSAGKSPSAGRGGGGGNSGTAVVPDAGGAGAGGMVDAGGDAGSDAGGAPPIVPTTFRYVKLVALTEQSGHVWSSVAELQVLTTGSKPLSSSGWTIKADSEETSTETAPATNAIDGKSTTYWHTHWTWDAAADAPLPHNLIVDLGAAAVVTGFTYLPRQDSKTNGRIKDWAFYVSSNGTSWGSPVKTGSFPSGTALQTVTF